MAYGGPGRLREERAGARPWEGQRFGKPEEKEGSLHEVSQAWDLQKPGVGGQG